MNKRSSQRPRRPRSHSSGSSGLLTRFVSLVVFLFTLKWADHFRIVSLEARRLTGLLLHGTKTWIVMLGRLLLYVCVMMPGWFELLRYWLFDDKILRNVEYGKGSLSRNVLDVYLPNGSLRWNSIREGDGFSKGSPVVIFVGGGVWIIGNKLWSALIARCLTSLGYIVIVPDYRQCPQGTIEDMCEDLTSTLKWTVANCWHYGGDKNHVILAGQSAGAHIVLCSVLDLFEGRRRRGGRRQVRKSKRGAPSKRAARRQQQQEDKGGNRGSDSDTEGRDRGRRIEGEEQEGCQEKDGALLARSGGGDESMINSPHDMRGNYADLSQCLDNTAISESGAASGAAHRAAPVLEPSSPGFFNRIYSRLSGTSSRPAQPVSIPGTAAARQDSDSASFGSLNSPGFAGRRPHSSSSERQDAGSVAALSPLTSSVLTALDESFSLSQRSQQNSFDVGAEANGLELTSLSAALSAGSDSGAAGGGGGGDSDEGRRSLMLTERMERERGGGEGRAYSSDSSSDSEVESATWTERRTPGPRDKGRGKGDGRGGEKDPRTERGGGSSRVTTPYSYISRSASSDGLDTDYIYFVPSSPHTLSDSPPYEDEDGAGEDDDDDTIREEGQEQEQEESVEERATRRALLASVKQLVLLNGPYNLCTLQAHLHRRGLDSSILRWIFGDFPHYSPTLRIRALAARLAQEQEEREAQGQEGQEGQEEQEQALSWEDFPPVGLFSCVEDKSIPLEQGRGLLEALRGVSYRPKTGAGAGAGEGGRLGACLVEYPGQIHTSLVVEGPLEGDTTLPTDFDAMARLVHEKGAGALSSFSSVSSSSSSTTGDGGGKMRTAKTTRSKGRAVGRGRGRGRAGERGAEPAVHPWLVAIAKRVNPF